MTGTFGELESRLPPAARRRIVALLDEFERRAKNGRRIPESLRLVLDLDKAGKIQEVELPERYGWEGQR